LARISGIDIPREKRVEIGLQYIYGIGPKIALRVLEATAINPDTRVRDLTEEEVNRINAHLAGPRPAHPHQCPHPQGTGQGHRGQEAGPVQGVIGRPGAQV
jgi:ribosomal protein S13